MTQSDFERDVRELYRTFGATSTLDRIIAAYRALTKENERLRGIVDDTNTHYIQLQAENERLRDYDCRSLRENGVCTLQHRPRGIGDDDIARLLDERDELMGENERLLRVPRKCPACGEYLVHIDVAALMDEEMKPLRDRLAAAERVVEAARYYYYGDVNAPESNLRAALADYDRGESDADPE